MLQQRLAEIARSLAADSSLSIDEALDQLMRGARTPGYGQLVRRVALSPTFDRALYDAVLAAGLDGVPAFDDFVKTPDVEALAERGRYALQSHAREQAMRGWLAEPEAKLRMHRALDEFERERNPDDPFARLPHLMLIAPEQALTMFTAAFDEADAKFDLARCFALINVVTAPGGQASSSLQQAIQRRRRRHRARSMFAEAWYRTVTYVRRDEPHDKFDAWLKDPTQWIFHVHATGGMGKTMFLRWLLARQLVPGDVPCARVDFDELKLEAVRRWPWLALVPLVEQLDEQLEERYLAEALVSAQPYLSLLHPSPASAALETMLPDMAAEGEAFIGRVEHALREAGAPRLILVLDTLEIVDVVPQTLHAIMAALQRLHRAAPGLRVVLSGRYDLSARVPSLSGLLAEFGCTVSLGRLEVEQAQEYLKDERGIDDAEMRATVIEKVSEADAPKAEAKTGEAGTPEQKRAPGCNPFKLSLLADLALQGLTVDEVRALPNADYAYLIERVVKRIAEQPLRWVVRYGALPRRLSRDYVARVLIDPLREALSGHAQGDTLTQQGGTDRRSALEQDVWRPEPGEVTPDGLWKSLQSYESRSGWITSVGKPDAQLMQFHSDVVDPMRDLLSGQDIFPRLQARSVAYFEAKAEAARVEFENEKDDARREKLAERWAEAKCEALFHRFQAREPQASQEWTQTLDHPMLSAYPRLRVTVASEPLGREYCQDGEVPRLREGQPLVDREQLIWANLRTAQNLLAHGIAFDQGQTSSQGSEVQLHLARAERLIHDQPLRGEYEPMLAVLRAAVEALRGDFAAAIALYFHAAAMLPSGAERAYALANAARGQLATRDRACLATFGRALSEFPPDHPAAAEIEFEFANAAFAMESYDEGRRAAAHVIRAGIDNGDERARLNALGLAWLEAGLGNNLAAIRLAELFRLGDSGPSAADALTLLRASTDRNLARSQPALIERVVGIAEAARHPLDQATALRLAGIVAMDTIRVSDALEYWSRSSRLLEGLGGGSAAASQTGIQRLGQKDLLVQHVAAHNLIGAFREALALAQSADSLPESDPTVGLNLQLERAAAFAHLGDGDDAAAALREVGHAELAGRPVTQSLYRALAAALGIGLRLFEPTGDTLDRLIGELATLGPPQRWLVLQTLLRFGESTAPAPRFPERLLQAFSFDEEPSPYDDWFPPADPADVRDAAFLTRLRAFDRCCLRGPSDTEANALLRELVADAARPPTIAQRLLLVGTRRQFVAFASGSDPIAPQAEPEVPADTSELLRAAIVLNRAERRMQAGELDETGTLLKQAQECLMREPLRTRWHARWLALSAGLAGLREDEAECRRLLDLAQAMYRELGNMRAVAALPGSIPLPDGLILRESGSLVEAGADQDVPGRADVSPSPSPAPIELAPRWIVEPAGVPGRPATARQQEILSMVQAAAKGRVADEFVEMLARDWTLVRRELGRLLFEGQVPPGADAFTLGIKIAPGALARLPWEMAALPGEDEAGQHAGFSTQLRAWSRVRGADDTPAPGTVQFVQQRLGQIADGIVGPRTVAVIKRFQEEHGLAPSGRIDAALLAVFARARRTDGSERPRVLVLQPGAVHNNVDQTTYASRGGRDLDRLFGRWANVTVVDDLSGDRLREVISSLTPPLIHVVTTIRETSGVVFLDTTRRRGSTEGAPLSASYLASTVKRCYGQGPAPFLILDVVRPSATYETALALLLRNALAADLMQFGGFSGVLAAGLEPVGTLGRLAEALDTTLRIHGTMGDVVNAVRRVFAGAVPVNDAKGRQDAALAYLGCALFAQDPELPGILW